ncbi:hypothetical protein ACLBPO_26535, partial [Klebsiella pneumoniae]
MFFDLDGTLHQQDMFGSFLRYLLRHLPHRWQSPPRPPHL